MADIGMELRSGQVSAVESLGTNRDGVDYVLMTGNGLLNGGPVALEGRLGKQVIGIGGLANPTWRSPLAPQAPRLETSKAKLLTTCPGRP